MIVKILGGILLLASFVGLYYVTTPFVPQEHSDIGDTWLVYDDSISENTSDRIVDFLQQTNIDALIISTDANVLYEYGDVDKATNLASVRKSIISLLYGIAIDKGLIDVFDTLQELYIDESLYPLGNIEQTATIKDLLMARSGVYIPSGAESSNMQESRPQRYQYAPGEHYYYNNWDFNVLGFIFEQETGLTIGEALESWVGDVVGFQDFSEDHVIYNYTAHTDYPTRRIYMSARDLSKIGSMLLRGGMWDGNEVVAKERLEESFVPYSLTDSENIYYGYMWWVDTQRNIVYGQGSGGQYLIIDVVNNLSITVRKDTGVAILSMLYYRFFEQPAGKIQTLELYDLVVDELFQ